MFFERHCPVCDRPARRVCGPCWAHFEPGVPATIAELSRFAELDSLVALFDYDEAVRRMIVHAKNGGRRDLLRALARALAESIAATAPVREVDVVAWVPASVEHRRHRGFDQGRLLAGGVADRIGAPRRRLLQRIGQSQKGLTRRQRLAGAGMASIRPATGAVLLVDDVATTGASLRSASAILRANGAESVHGAVVAAVTR